MSALQAIPCWLFVVGFIWCAFQGFRGAVEHRLNHNAKLLCHGDRWINARSPEWESWERWVVLYVHDFAFRFICTAAGFIALFLAYAIAPDLTALKALEAPTSALLVFLLLIGVIGVGGQLHYAILLGKVLR